MSSADGSKTWLEVILRPLVRFILRRGVVFQEFDRAARKVFVEVASDELRRSTTKINVSRISVLTGLQRPEVLRFQKEAPTLSPRSISLTTRVISRWETHRRYRTKDGAPRVLKHDAEKSEFSELCNGVSSAINAGTLLFEMQRTGMVKVTPHGVKLVRLVEGSLHDAEKFHNLLGRDLDSLLTASEENARRANSVPNHHTRTEYDNICVEKVGEIREWLATQGSRFHKQIREYLSQFDLDINPEIAKDSKGGAKIAITSYSLAVTPTNSKASENLKKSVENPEIL